MTRVLVCGSRDYQNYLTFAREMRHLESEHGPFDTIIHGGARGTDWMAHLYVGERMEIIFEADWDKHGKAAGPIRNQRMLDEGKPEMVIAFKGGRGTADMVRRAKAAGVRVVIAFEGYRP